MGLSSALSTAMAGLRANQASLSVVSSNIANAQTPGYIRQSAIQLEATTGQAGSTVRTAGVNRELDTFLQTQLRTETSGADYATRIADMLGNLQTLYGTPGEAGSLEFSFGNFTNALQTLSGSAGSSSARVAALAAAQSLAQSLNAATSGIQALRSNAEQSLATASSTANATLSQIASINTRLQGMTGTDPATASLMNQRDTAISTLSGLMDVRVVTDNTNQVTIYTNAGVPLVAGALASQFTFNTQGTLSANSAWSADSTKSSVGTLMLTLPNGARIDAIANGAITSGSMAADIQLRDKILVQAQSQMDQLAATLASSLSDVTTQGTAATSGTTSGFDVDLTGLLQGNKINLTYLDTATNTQKQVTIVRVDDPAALPLSNAGAAPNTQTIGVNFSGGMASVLTQLTTALGGAGLSFSNPAGSTLRVLDTVANTASVTSAATTVTTTALAGGVPQLAVFTDGKSAYSGVIASGGNQITGLAGRIAVNPALLADTAKLSNYSGSTQPADTTRSDFLYTQLTAGIYAVGAQTGLGTPAAPYKSTITGYLQDVLGLQSNALDSASQLKEGQDVVVNTLQSKFAATSGVSIDTEMSNLIALQNTYAANAHVMSVVQQMMASLMQTIN